MYQFDMTDDEIRETKWAAKEVAKHLDGVKLIDGLRIGEALLRGRQHAMRAAGANKPNGKAYAVAFRDWKQAFKFREGREAENYYDSAIVCAQHRTIANEIVSLLSAKQKTEMGMHGLAKRVRAKLNELEGEPKPARIKPASWRNDVNGRLADIEERVMASEPKHVSELVKLLVRRTPKEVAEMLHRTDPTWFADLLAAMQEEAAWQPTPKA
jgi:hypothetical protein